MVVQIPTRNLHRFDGLEVFDLVRMCRLHNFKLHLLAVFKSTKSVRVAPSYAWYSIEAQLGASGTACDHYDLLAGYIVVCWK